jgi:hypothetical protein
VSPAVKRVGIAIGAGLLVMLSARLSHAGPLDANGNEARVIGGRPAGCPHAFCGCGLARFLGLEDRRLWLAANWPRLFHRTQAHAGAVAARAHHVMLLVEHVAMNPILQGVRNLLLVELAAAVVFIEVWRLVWAALP